MNSINSNVVVLEGSTSYHFQNPKSNMLSNLIGFEQYVHRKIIPPQFNILSAENQKGVNAVQRCSVEKQKDAIAIDFYSDSAPLVVNGTLLNNDNALLALN